MSAGRHRLACLIAVAALAAPSAAWAQGAGDEQYQDPFGGDQSQGSDDQNTPSSSGDGGETAQAAPAPTAAPAAPAPVATTAQAQPAAQQLPRTGGDPTVPGIAGAVLLAGGVILRLRLRPR
jgi:LPXTG-motif cell wall-anchored protein